MSEKLDPQRLVRSGRVSGVLAASDPYRRGTAIGRILRVALLTARGKIGLAIEVVMILVIALGPVVAPHGPTEFVTTPFAAPSADAWLGADVLGRDVLSRLLWGGYRIILLALAATFVGVGIGMILGVLAGYARNLGDEVVMRALDVLLSFPQVILILLFLSLIGPKLWLIVLVIAAVHAPQVARVARAATLEVRGREFVAWAEALGIPRWRIMLTEIVPNISSPILVELGLRFTYSIGLLASISFLGFGARPPAADWGLMISENRIGLLTQPLGVVTPVAAVALLTIGANLMTDAIARALIGIERAGGAAPDG